METPDFYKDVFGLDEQVMPCFPNAEYFTNVVNAESEYDRVNALYGKRFEKPSSLIVIHPTVESMKVYGDAYRYLSDYFLFDETMPNCDFDKIPKNVPVLMIGPGDRTGILSDNYKYSTPIRNMRYLVKPAYYREYYEAVTGRRYLGCSLRSVEYFCQEQVWSSEEVSKGHYEEGLRDRECNVIGFWPFSVEWARWHGLSGVFFGDLVLDSRSAYFHGYRRLLDENIHIEQERLIRMLRSLIKEWPTHTLNVEVLEQLDEGATTIAKHNNKEIYLTKDGRVVRRYGCNANDYE